MVACANLLRALLESHGVFAYVWGEHLGSIDVRAIDRPSARPIRDRFGGASPELPARLRADKRGPRSFESARQDFRPHRWFGGCSGVVADVHALNNTRHPLPFNPQ